MENCIFCKIGKGEAQAEVEFENENVIAFKSISPVAETHILIVPKEHFAEFIEIPQDSTIMNELRAVAQDMISKYNIQGAYKLVFNGGKYPEIRHLHWHLLGGKLEDESDTLNRT